MASAPTPHARGSAPSESKAVARDGGQRQSRATAEGPDRRRTRRRPPPPPPPEPPHDPLAFELAQPPAASSAAAPLDCGGGCARHKRQRRAVGGQRDRSLPARAAPPSLPPPATARRPPPPPPRTPRRAARWRRRRRAPRPRRGSRPSNAFSCAHVAGECSMVVSSRQHGRLEAVPLDPIAGVGALDAVRRRDERRERSGGHPVAAPISNLDQHAAQRRQPPRSIVGPQMIRRVRRRQYKLEIARVSTRGDVERRSVDVEQFALRKVGRRLRRGGGVVAGLRLIARLAVQHRGLAGALRRLAR